MGRPSLELEGDTQLLHQPIPLLSKVAALLFGILRGVLLKVALDARPDHLLSNKLDVVTMSWLAAWVAGKLLHVLGAQLVEPRESTSQWVV